MTFPHAILETACLRHDAFETLPPKAQDDICRGIVAEQNPSVAFLESRVASFRKQLERATGAGRDICAMQLAEYEERLAAAVAGQRMAAE